MKVFLWILLLPLVCAEMYGQPQLTKSQQAMCVPVKYTGKKAFVEVYLKSGFKKDEKLPALIFHVSQMPDLDLPLVSEFIKDPLRWANGDKFDVDTSRVDKEKVKNSYISKDKRLKLDVKESGFYCVYVAAPQDTDFMAPIIYKSSYGYLNYFEYVTYSQTRIGIFIVIIATIILFRDLIRNVGQDFSNLNNISVVSKSAILYVLLPKILLEVLTLVSDFFLNHSKEAGFITQFFRDLVQWLTGCYDILLSYMVLVFCMGYGVLYYHHQTKSYRELPRSKVALTKGLLAINLGVYFVFTIATLFRKNSQVALVGADSGDDQFGTSQAAYALLGFVLSLLGLVWLVLSVYHGFQTIKTIDEFPPYSNTVENSTEKNADLRKAFKRSLYLIFLLPVYSTFFVAFFVLFQTQSQYFDTYSPDIDPKYIPYLVSDLMIDHSKGIYYQVWNQYLVGLISIVGIFFLWVKGNQGLVIDKEEDFEPVPQVDSDPEFV